MLGIIDAKPQPMSERRHHRLQDGQRVSHGSATAGQMPELGDSVGHLGIQPGGTDIHTDSQIRFQRIRNHRHSPQLDIHVQKIIRRAEIAYEIVPASAWHTADRDIAVSGSRLQHFI